MTLVYQVPQTDAIQYSTYLESDNEALHNVLEGKKKLPSFPGFATEVFSRLYDRTSDRKLPDNQIQPENSWAVAAHESLSSSPEFEDLCAKIKSHSRQDLPTKRMLAGQGSDGFVQSFANQLPKPASHLADLDALKKEWQDTQQALEEFEDELSEEQLSQLKDNLKQLKVKIDQEKIKANRFNRRISKDIPMQTKIAIRAASEAVDNAIASMQVLGCGNEPGTNSPAIPPQVKQQLFNQIKNNKTLQLVVKLAGRLSAIAQKKQQEKDKECPIEAVSITTGNDLSRILPSEMVKMFVPGLDIQFAIDYSQGNLLQYELSSHSPKGKGPIVICLDSSGSMKGLKEAWSKAVALTMLNVAKRQKRHCRILHFGSYVCRVDDFEPGETNPQKLLNCLTYFNNGGTNWEKPFTSAVQIIEQQTQYQDADIILIGDDECGVSPSWLQQFKQKQQQLKFTVYGILLGCNQAQSLNAIADRVVLINDLASDDTDAHIIFDI